MSSILSLPEFLSSEYVKRPFATVIGNPIHHSLSPLIHNQALKRVGLPITYYAVLVKDEDLSLLHELFNHPNFHGSNVTIPHKRAVLPFLHSVSPKVEQTRACNTVYRSEEILKGDNTDVYGFMSPLQSHLHHIQHRDAVVFGTGGAASAVVCGLLDAGVGTIYLVSRSANVQHDILPSERVQRIHYEQWPDYCQNAVLFVNTTPVGMYPHESQSVVSDEQAGLLAGSICYDLIYRPKMTRFLQQGAAQKATVIDGTEMFLGQAAKAFSLFFGTPFPTATIRPILNDALE